MKFLESGSNNTDKNTYADSNETIPNTNPVQLDAEGRCPNIFGQGSYRAISYTNDPVLDTPAVQIQQFDPVGGTSGTGAFSDWDGVTTFILGDIVTASDGNYYRSLISSNSGNDPTISMVSWEQIEMLAYWNINRTYAIGDKVRYGDKGVYTSLKANNLGKLPYAGITGVYSSYYWQKDFNPNWTIKTGTSNAFPDDYIDADTSSGAWTLTIPDSLMSEGAKVVVHDYAGTWAAKNLTISSPLKLAGTNDNFICNIDNLTLTLIFASTLKGWKVI